MTDDTFLDSLIAFADKRSYEPLTLTEHMDALRALRIRSTQDLIERLPLLGGAELRAAIRAAVVLKLRAAGPRIVPFITADDPNLRFAAQEALTSLSSRRTYGPLARIASTHPDVDVAASACYALSFMSDRAAARPLLEVFQTPGLADRVKAQAAEGLGNALGYTDRRKTLFKTAAAAVIAGLHDPSPEVRFWCCFALGQMRANQAVPELTRLAAEDDAFCPGWWFVREEACDALLWIQGKSGPDRETLGWTESGPRVPEGYDLDGNRICA